MEQQRLTGAQRARAYTEVDDGEEFLDGDGPALGEDGTALPLEAPAAAPTGPRTPHAGSPMAVAVPNAHLAGLEAPSRPRPAQWGWRARLGKASGGTLKLAPSEQELAHREAVSTIRRATWTRAVNVLVANPKGGVGKTPAAVILAGILGQIRGGYVAAFEAAESPGTLARRAEGRPARGLAEMLAAAPGIKSAGHLGGYTAPQTSHADVIGTVAQRNVLTDTDVITTRGLLDAYYRITIADTGNNPGHPAFTAALRTADALVLPCLMSLDALAGVEEALADATNRAPVYLHKRAVVILGHDGGPEDTDVTRTVRARLDALGLPVCEVPYDPAIRLGGEISLAALTETSARAWTLAAAAVIQALNAAPLDIDLVEDYAAAARTQRH